MKAFLGKLSLFPIQDQRWFQKIREWLRLKKLEHELRASRSFQRHCQKINCPNLAALEHAFQETLLRRIGEAKQRGKPLSSPAPQNLNLQTET